MTMLTKYNELVAEHNAQAKKMLEELEACGFAALVKECFDSKEFDKLKIELKNMEDSVPKAYIKRKMRFAIDKDLGT